MTSNLDIYRTANVLVKRYGEDAAHRALVDSEFYVEEETRSG